MQCESLKIIKLNCHFNFRISLPLLCTTQIHLARKKDFLYIYIYIYTQVHIYTEHWKNRLDKIEHPWSFGQHSAGHREKVSLWGFSSHLLFLSLLLGNFSQWQGGGEGLNPAIWVGDIYQSCATRMQHC